jgi:hypothetical protein
MVSRLALEREHLDQRVSGSLPLLAVVSRLAPGREHLDQRWVAYP